MNGDGVLVFPRDFDISPDSHERQHDMSRYIQDAVDSCAAHKIGTLLFQPNRYPIKQPILIRNPRLTIKSTTSTNASIIDANYTPIFQLTDDMPYGFFVSNDPDMDSRELIGNVEFRNICVLSIGKKTDYGLITFWNAHSSGVFDCYVGGVATPGGMDKAYYHKDMSNAHQGSCVQFIAHREPWSTSTWVNRVDSNDFHWSTGPGLINESSDSYIFKNYISHTAGVREHSFSNNRYIGNHVDNTINIGDSTGFSFVETRDDVKPRQATTLIQGNTFDIHQVGLQLSAANQHTVIVGNHFRDNRTAHIDLSSAKNFSICANAMREVKHDGHRTFIDDGDWTGIIENNTNQIPADNIW